MMNGRNKAKEEDLQGRSVGNKLTLPKNKKKTQTQEKYTNIKLK